jgi:acetolactate synthase-1/2/3 large subunit
VFCITGEGSIQMCIRSSHLPAVQDAGKIVSLNNRYLGMVRQWQQIDYGGAIRTATWTRCPIS